MRNYWPEEVARIELLCGEAFVVQNSRLKTPPILMQTIDANVSIG
jgi:hypothetical protein